MTSTTLAGKARQAARWRPNSREVYYTLRADQKILPGLLTEYGNVPSTATGMSACSAVGDDSAGVLGDPAVQPHARCTLIHQRNRVDRPRSGPTRMARLAGFAQRHHWTALLCWVVVLVGIAVAGQAVGDDYGNGSDVSLPDTQSQELADLLEKHAPEQTGDSVTVVLYDERGWDTDADLEALTDDLSAVEQVETITPPALRQGTVSADGTLALVGVALEGEQGAAPPETYEQIVDVTRAHASEDLQVEVAGKGIRQIQQAEGTGAEIAGCWRPSSS